MEVHYKNNFGTICPGGFINYTIAIYLKDGRYKYEFSNFYHTGNVLSLNIILASNLGACEGMVSFEQKSFQLLCNYFLNEMDYNIKNLIIDLNSSMSTKAKQDGW